MAGDPTDIGGTPPHRFLVGIERPLHRLGDPQRIAAGAMKDTLRFAGAAGSVQDKQRIIGIHFLRGDVFVAVCQNVRQPDITFRIHFDVVAGVFNNYYLLYTLAEIRRLDSVVL